ncbi:MAG TPA: hypothetical protein VH309_03470, partial [Elusimicrobiota bacterium]|nr:hypothetical protein [Elusimicrobiota bacterium]
LDSNPVTWTSIDLSGSSGGYAGIHFTDVGSGDGQYLMVGTASNVQGFYNGSAWSWYFNGGVLTAGSVPSASVNAGSFQSAGYTFPSTLTLGSNLTFSPANPTITASSYISMPGGLYIDGTVPLYIETGAHLNVRSGIYNDSGSNLTLYGGTSGNTVINGSTLFGTGGSYMVTNGGVGTFATSKFGGLNPTSDTVGVMGSSTLRWNNIHAVNFYGAYNAGPDLAERYPASEAVEPGDLVVFDRSAPADKTVFDQSKVTSRGTEVGGKKIPVAVRKSTEAYQDGVFGVVSTAPGVRLHDPDDAKNPPIALIGRVPVKVSAINGAIYVGDYLTASTIPGVAMKATEPGPTIAIALQDFDGTTSKTGKILAFVRSSDSSNEAREIRKLEDENRDLLERVERLEKMISKP